MNENGEMQDPVGRDWGIDIGSYTTARKVQPLLAICSVLGQRNLQLGALFLGLSLFFAQMTLPKYDLVPLASRIWQKATTTAVVSDVEKGAYTSEDTNKMRVEVGRVDIRTGDRRSRRSSSERSTDIPESERIYHTKYTYSFQDSNGNEQEASFRALGGELAVGDNVEIEYIVEKPTISRIAGLKSGASMYAAGAVLVFLLIGCVVVVGGLKRGVQAINLLGKGEVSQAKLISKIAKKKPGSGRGDSTKRATFDYYLKYAFKASDGETHEVENIVPAGIADVHNPKPDLDDDVEQIAYVLYNPQNPDMAMLAEQFPGNPKFDQPSIVYSGKPALVVAYLIVPTLSVSLYFILRNIF